MSKIDRGFMEWNMFRQIIDELAEIRKIVNSKFSELHFYLDGEPFLHEEYIDMLRYIDSSLSGIRIIISTNCSLMTSEIVDTLLNLRANNYIFIFSLDASNEILYRQIKYCNYFVFAEENVRYFLNKKIEKNINNPYAVLQFIVMSVNEQDMNDFYWKWESLLGPKHKAGYCLWTDHLLRENSSHIYWKRFYSNSNPFQTDDPLYSSIMGTIPHGVERPKICAWPWRMLSIGWNGDLHPCCFFPDHKSILGNFSGKSIKDIFEGEEIKQLRRLFLDNKIDQIPICKRCDRTAWWHDNGLEDYLGI
jgi:radical SAM protein with 4Fe4S-binding SPASM domain